MKKLIKLMSLMLCLVVIALLGGCSFSGYDWIDTNYHFNRAIISLPNGEVVEGKIVKWADATEGEQLTIELDNGKRYLVNSLNCVLIED